MTLEDKHIAEHIRLHDGSDDVRSYMATVLTCGSYGWLYYPLNALADFLLATAVEMALKRRLSKKATKKERGLRQLLQLARNEGLCATRALRSVSSQAPRRHVASS